MKAGLDVFDFKEEGELPELVVAKFNNPSFDNSVTLMPDLLECLTQGSDVLRKENTSLTCMDVDATEYDHVGDVAISNAPLGMQENSAAVENSNQDPCPNIFTDESRSSFTAKEARVSCHETVSPGKSQLNCSLSHSLSNSIPDDVKSEDEESMNDVKSDAVENVNESSPSNPSSNIAECDAIFNRDTSDNCFSDNVELAKIDIPVDYVLYRDNYCSGSLVTFSCNGIKVDCPTTYGDQGTFYFERGIDDIIHIESQYLERLRTVNVKVRILSKEAVHVDNAENGSGVEELEFAAVVLGWLEMLEEITSLNKKYCALWSVVNEMDVTADGGADLLLQRSYFPNFEEAFGDVVYPKGDSDAVSISKRDVDLLQPETFINDTIIDFYIKYLKNQIPAEEKHRFHFFNSFFFRKLADLDKDPSSALDGRAAFLRVHKWTRKVDIFGKDYIFIPVNFNLHWSLLVICHPGEVAGFEDDSRKLLRVPCILHMDSIKGTHAGLKSLVQSYLWEEWKERQKGASEDLSSKFLNLRFIPLELPQQENSFDCGLFLLHYLELFLIDAPANFNPFKINKFSKFLNIDWFPPAEASLKRTLIQWLISDLIGNRSGEVSSGNCGNEPRSNFPENSWKKTDVDFISGRSISCQGNLLTSEVMQGTEITLLEASSMRNPQCVNNDPLVLRELFEPGVSTGSLLAQCTSFDQPSPYYRLNGTMSQIEDDAETGEQFVYFPSGESVFRQIAGTTPQAGSFSYPYRGYGSDATWNPGFSMQGEDDDSSLETSTSNSDDSDVGIIENCSFGELICQKEKCNQQRSPSTENSEECTLRNHDSATTEMLETTASEGTEDSDEMNDSEENGNLASSQENPTTSAPEDPRMVENELHQDLEEAEVTGGVQTIDDPVAEFDDEQAAKRRRLTHSFEGDGGVYGSVLPTREGICLDGSQSDDLRL